MIDQSWAISAVSTVVRGTDCYKFKPSAFSLQTYMDVRDPIDGTSSLTRIRTGVSERGVLI